MTRIRRVDSNRSSERQQWAQLERYRKDMKVIGNGEGQAEVYFGRGFSSPPTFSYSAIFNQEPTEVLPWHIVPARGVSTATQDQYGLGSDYLGPGGMIEDPSFEMQGKWRRVSTSSGWEVIPDVYEYSQALDSYDYGSGSYEDSLMPVTKWVYQNYSSLDNDWSPKFRNDTGPNDRVDYHRWVQTNEVRERWSLTNSDHHDLKIGNEGEVCATAVVGSGGYTNWLLPFEYSRPYDHYARGLGSAWRMWRTTSEALAATGLAVLGGGPSAYSVPPPYIEGFRGFAYLKSSSGADVELQVKATGAFYDYRYDGDRGTKVFPESEVDWGVPAESDMYTYRELASVDFTELARGDGWHRVDWDTPYQGWRSWPMSQACAISKGEPREDVFWNLKFRVKGTPGDTVFVDNVFGDRQMRNQEVPMMTIGVSEWIQDDAGAYIGAKLWVTKGEPRREVC